MVLSVYSLCTDFVPSVLVDDCCVSLVTTVYLDINKPLRLCRISSCSTCEQRGVEQLETDFAVLKRVSLGRGSVIL